MPETKDPQTSPTLSRWAEHDVAGLREGAGTLVLDRPDSFWLVVEGGVELYALPRSVPGRRRFLWSAGAGAILPPVREGSASALLAVASEGTRLVQMHVSALPDLAARGEADGALTAAVEGLAAAAAAVLLPALRPAFDSLLGPGDQARLPRGRRAGIRGRVAWIRFAAGHGLLADAEVLPVTSSEGALPIARGLWVTVASEEARLTVGDTADLLQRPEGWCGIEALMTLVLAWADSTAKSDEAAHRERARRRSNAEARMARESLAHLVSALGGAAEAVPAGASADLLLDACRAVGKAAEIAFVAPPKWEEEGRVRDRLAAICRVSRVRHRRVALRGTWWLSDCGPLLGYDAASGAPVALVPEGADRYRAFDPSTGQTEAIDAVAAPKLSPFAESFYRPTPQRPIPGLQLLRLALPDLRSDVRTALLMALGGGLLGLAVPFATGRIFSEIIPNARPTDLLTLFAGLLGVALGTALFDLTRAIALVRIEGKWSASLQAAVVDRLLALPVPFFRRYTVGDLALRAGAISSLRQILGGAAIGAILSGVFSVLYLAQMFLYSARLAFVALALLAVAVAVNAGFGAAAMRLERNRQRVSGRIAGLVFQMIAGVAKLRVAGAEGRAFAVWCGRFGEQKKLAYRSGGYQNVIRVFNEVLPVVSAGALFAVAGHAASISPGRFLAFQAAFGAFFAAGIALSNTLVDTLDLFPALERARPILEAQPEATAGKPDPGALAGRIAVDHVHFRYLSDGPHVLEDVSLAAEPGEFVAVVGPSGSGKSTLLRLLLGFEFPESGSLYYDGQDLSSVDLTAVRSQIGVVLQSSRLLSGDIFTNIVGSAPLTLDDAWMAAEMAGLGDDIRELPMGMQTVVSEGGTTFSGGQRQRLLIARALVRKPRIVLFDEATSALDNRTQETVRSSLERLNATRIIIAHRLSTIQRADRIYVLEAGRVVQTGDFEQLASVPGLFARLVARQIA